MFFFIGEVHFISSSYAPGPTFDPPRPSPEFFLIFDYFFFLRIGLPISIEAGEKKKKKKKILFDEIQIAKVHLLDRVFFDFFGFVFFKESDCPYRFSRGGGKRKKKKKSFR